MMKNILVVLLVASSCLAKPSLPSTLPVIPVPIPAYTGLAPGASVPAVVNGPAIAVPAPLSNLQIATMAAQVVAALPVGAPPNSLAGAIALIGYLQTIVSYGATIAFSNGQLTVGGVSLPSYITCQTIETKLLACHICNYDCVYVHNTYGGTCATDTAVKGKDCVCQDDRNANGTVTPVVDVCGPIAGSSLDDAIDYILKEFLYAREMSLCQPTGGNTFMSSGCAVDCARNHQYDSGNCEVTNSIPFTPEQTTTSANGDNTYCICNYNSTTTATSA